MTNLSYLTTPDEVRRLIGVDNSVISDADANALIEIAQAEVERQTHTDFLVAQADSTATSGDTSTVNDTNASYTADEWNSDENLVGGYAVWIYSGTGSGQIRTITNNTDTALTVSPVFSTAPDNTSKYRIIKNTYHNETFSGDGTEVYFTEYYPIKEIVSIEIDSTSITESYVYNTGSMGKLELGSSAEKSTWDDNYPLLCNIKYYSGVYPVPSIVEKYCAILAAIYCAEYMIGSTYTFATSYSHPDISISKGVPYPHFEKVFNSLVKKRDWYEKEILKSFIRPMFG